ncbi:glycosyltransferase family 4 protein [Leptolyngbya sp. O-77]|uniref:glycosyltransferase family 4 protein n=1 Tax=Leptolyngbya sp. O-77 TaxID=1080068 RepID=UPI00074D356A|nr:glycosyltransferase family 4 protein [Leptolyngbya sp. O-77]BAU42322.1 GalNAc-alpha-(1->4)-GalNAc-alpha-(1->3)-diNAcBac-PP-undecaprenol alpha-1,4-N-acetyl-D-galactosaminyltransferase [Leptolyngbya sp. O-77]
MKILMLGEALSRKGGIVSVQQLILEQADSTVKIEHIATLVDGSPAKKLLAFFKSLFDLSSKLLLGKIDLVHIHVSERGSAFRQSVTTLVSKLFGKPVVMHTHGSEFHEFYSHLPIFLRVFLGWTYRQCDRFIVLSESWKRFYVEALKLKEQNVSVLPNAVRIPDQIPRRIGGRDNEVLFVFFGRIGQRKGAFDLVQSLLHLPACDRTRLRLVMAGDGETEKLRELVLELGLDHIVIVRDWVSPQEREALSREASVFILPSYNEGLPMALLEAMSWGLAIITTPVGGIPGLIKHKENGILVEPGDIYQIADAIRSLLENNALRTSLGQAARESVLPFGADSYWKALTNIYSSTATQRTATKR